ncbi:MAG: hypothetical protein ABI910_06675 [Gemmatimonadota bacterium]
MITRCAWCDSTFPNNDGVETLPVGRRIAFDEQRGRLWVVCRRCERWNLVPMEERWEAIEECARTFQQSRLRASTDQIGLARLADGTALIRIGRPVRAEFAAWRYGDQFGRRRTRAIIGGVAAAAAVGAGAAGALAFGASLLGILPLFQVVTFLSTAHTAGLLKRQQPLDDPDHGGQVLPIGHPRLIAAPESDGGWGLDVPYVSRTDATGAPSGTWWDRHLNKSVALGSLRLVGAPARLLLSRHAPRLNTSGAPSSRIRGAVELIATAGGADQLPGYLARNRARFTAQQTFGDSGELPALPSEVRLALEMAAHEEVERALVEGELAALEHQWRGAEEEAAISDDLLLPPGVRLSLDRIRREQDDSSKS